MIVVDARRDDELDDGTEKISAPRRTRGGREWIDNPVLERMEISRPIEAEILGSLARGKRTVSELTEEIYVVTRANSDYHACYMKVSRAAKVLQRRGYLSTKLLGRDKPYRLTPFAMAKMMDIEKEEQRILPASDIAACLIAVALAMYNIALISTSSDAWLSDPGTIVPYSLLLLASGYCISRLSIAVRKVS